MKQLTCEMCGSTDLMKQDGVFVCQTCGCKYSVEEARKMMMEVTGNVTVVNTANVDSLYKLALSSYESKNFEKAEDFCNQILSIDDQHFDAWVLKAKAIDGQINADHPRIEEVSNCILTAYKICPEESREEKAHELLDWLMTSFMSEISFWLKQIEVNRPTNANVAKAKNTYVSLWNKTQEIITKEMALPTEEFHKWRDLLDEHFASTMLKVAKASWEHTVSYNYYRGKYSFGTWTDKDYRPTEKIYNTFREEIRCLQTLLKVVEDDFTLVVTLPPELMKLIFEFEIKLNEEFVGARSWKPMVRTTTNGYGAVIRREEYWDPEWSATDGARDATKSIVASYRQKISRQDDRIRRIKEEKLQKEKQERIDKYWAEHAAEKEALDREFEELQRQKEDLEAQITAFDQEHRAEIEALRTEQAKQLPLEMEYDAQFKAIKAMEEQIDSLGLFKFKEKKALKEQLETVERPKLEKLKVASRDAKTQHQDALTAQIDAIMQGIQPTRNALEALKKRIAEITSELTQDR